MIMFLNVTPKVALRVYVQDGVRAYVHDCLRNRVHEFVSEFELRR